MNFPLGLWHQLKLSLISSKRIPKKHMQWLQNWPNILCRFALSLSSSRNATFNRESPLRSSTKDKARPFKADKRVSICELRVSWELLVKFWKTEMRPLRGDFPKTAWFLWHCDCTYQIICLKALIYFPLALFATIIQLLSTIMLSKSYINIPKFHINSSLDHYFSFNWYQTHSICLSLFYLIQNQAM